MWHIWKRRLNAYRIPIRKREGKRPLGRTRHRWEDNIKMYIQEMGWEGMSGLVLLRIGKGGGHSRMWK